MLPQTPTPDAAHNMADTPLSQLGRLRLTDLPNEILHQIMRELLIGRFRDTYHLAALRTLCRRFRDVVEPHLYHTISLEIGLTTQGLLCQGEFGMASLVSSTASYPELDRAMTERPSLRSLVRVLSLETSPVPTYKSNRVEHHLAILKRFRLLEEVHLSPPPMFSDLPVMTPLKFLELDFDRAIEYIPESTPRNDRHIAALKTVSRCLQIPTLRKVDVQSLMPEPHMSRQLHFEHNLRSSPITELHLIQCSDVWTDLLEEILVSVDSLESIIIDCRWCNDEHYNEERNLSGLDRALKIHQSSLTQLMIGASYDATMKTTVPMNTFGNFTTLKRLALPEQFLVPRNSPKENMHDLLPSSLCELQLEHCLDTSDTDDELPIRLKRYRSLANSKHTCLPALKHVIWWYHIRDFLRDRYAGTLPFEDALKLVDVFKCNGVMFEWGVASEFLATPFGKGLGVRPGTGGDQWWDCLKNHERRTQTR